MKRFFQFFLSLAVVLWKAMGMASQIRVVIDLSEQRAYLIEQGKVRSVDLSRLVEVP